MKKDTEFKFRINSTMLENAKRCAKAANQSLSQWLIEGIEAGIECDAGEFNVELVPTESENVPTKSKSVPTKQTEREDIVPTNVPTNKDKKKVVPTKSKEGSVPSWMARLKESQEKQKARKKA